jgi:toxin ParE1/3/4
MSAERFRLLPGAARDITEIWEFIAEDSPSAAERLRGEILEAIRRLVAFPQQGHWRSDLSARGLRFWTVGHYLMAYAPSEGPLLVVAVVDGRRRPREIARMLRGRTSP